MRLLYLSTPSFADCDFPLIRSFQEKGIDVTYLILLAPYSLHSNLININIQYPKTGIFPASIYQELRQYDGYMNMEHVFIANRTNSSMLSFSYWQDAWYVYDFIKKGHFDIVHTCAYLSGVKRLYYRLSKFITTIHDPFPHCGEKTIGVEALRRIAVKKSKGIVLLNETQKQRFCQFYGIDDNRVLINRLGIYDNIRMFVTKGKVKKQNNILFFGRISPYKGIEYLCESMRLVHSLIPDATLTIAGGGHLYFDAAKYESLGYVEIRNHYIEMPELAELLSQCAFCVCPYTDATQSGVIMTCYSLGKPVVATNVGGLVEMVEDGKTGVLVPPKNIKALTDAIITLLKDKEKLKRMSDYIIGRYDAGDKSWSGIADKYIGYYTSLLES